MQPMTRSLRWAAAAAFLTLIGIGIGSAGEPAGRKKAKGMTQATTNKTRIPPIDAKLPHKIQTATFALG